LPSGRRRYSPSGSVAIVSAISRTHAHTADTRMAVSTLTLLPELDCPPTNWPQKAPSVRRIVLPSQPPRLAEGFAADLDRAWNRGLLIGHAPANEPGDTEHRAGASEQRPGGAGQHPDASAQQAEAGQRCQQKSSQCAHAINGFRIAFMKSSSSASSGSTFETPIAINSAAMSSILSALRFLSGAMLRLSSRLAIRFEAHQLRISSPRCASLPEM